MATDTTSRRHCNHRFLPDHYVITPIRRAIHNRQDVLFELDGANAVLVRGDRGECSAESGFDPVKFCTAPVGRIRVTESDPSEADRRTQGQRVRNADELLWTAGFVASEGRLMEGCNTCDIVEIERWPNLTRRPHMPNVMRITAMLARHATSIAVTRRALKVEPGEINQVYSAARCAGIAHVINAAARDPILKPHRNQTLLGQLFAKIVGL